MPAICIVAVGGQAIVVGIRASRKSFNRLPSGKNWNPKTACCIRRKSIRQVSGTTDQEVISSSSPFGTVGMHHRCGRIQNSPYGGRPIGSRVDKGDDGTAERFQILRCIRRELLSSVVSSSDVSIAAETSGFRVRSARISDRSFSFFNP